MDRPVSKAHKRKVLFRKLAVVLLIILVPLVIILLLKGALTPVVTLLRVTTAQVDQGNLQITVQGSGVVIPNYEEVITAPFRSKVLKITKTPGVSVNTGDTLLVLDNEMAVNDLNKLQNELELKGIQKEKLKIQLKEMEENFVISRQIREIRIENLKSAYEAEAFLNKRGGSTKDVMKKAKTEWDIAILEFKQAVNNNDNQLKAGEAGVRELETGIRIQKNAIIEAKNLVGQAYVKAPFSGSLSSIINQPGAMISEGQEIARVADFSKYRMKGNVSNSWAGKVMAGQLVLIRDKEKMLRGTLENIMPSVSEGMIECMIRLDEGDVSNLRPNQQLEIRVVVSFKDDVLRLPNGTYYKDQGSKYMYVIRGNKAYRTKVMLGDASFDYVEVISGLEKGDQVILTDLAEKYDREEVRVK
ncbi:MAG: HlyD family efflux transporter periplasmic adaptor subunit [Bacteroidia bacterium]|nr:HlyD family efflux transporter periplasmic adaptor subunit [Bacteroidia bacterium]